MKSSIDVLAGNAFVGGQGGMTGPWTRHADTWWRL